MKLIQIALIAILLFSFLFIQTRYLPDKVCYEGDVVPLFSPDNAEEVFNLIKNAKHEIKLEVYEFSSQALADALIDARYRGVDVKVILDPSVYRNSGMLSYLLNNGIDANWSPKKFHSTHSKFAIFDDSIVLVGSTNWSENALRKNREASVIIYSMEISKKFERIFDSDFNS